MKEESWTKVMEEISDIHVVEAVRLRRKHRRPLWMGLIAVAVVAAVVLGNLFWKEEKPVMPTAQRPLCSYITPDCLPTPTRDRR